MSLIKTDIAILGGGMVGLSLAHQIKNKYKDLSITIIEKEEKIGLHTSGRNSGVLHAGIYYPPNSQKAKVCVNGSKRLQEWCIEQEIKVNRCGKIITPQRADLDSQLEVLLARAKSNSAEAYIIDEIEFNKIVPDGRTASGRALWSPNTCVVDPKIILRRLFDNLVKKNVRFLFTRDIKSVNILKKKLFLNLGIEKEIVEYGHVFNCCGLYSDKVAKKFEVGENFNLLPFKGVYWALKKEAPFNFKTNLYPVPDLSLPFLGIHVTPCANGLITLGPTAIPALGRENYEGLSNFEPINSISFAYNLLNQWKNNKNGFRNYAKELILHGFKSFFLKSAQQLIPELKSEHLIKFEKVGIRAQLFDKKSQVLVNDFVMEESYGSTHVLNAISPAFTASFELADLILDKSCFNK